jgi:hypothetical protein
MACVTVTNLSTRGEYAVLDPRRTPGPGPFRFGYNLAADGIIVDVKRNPALLACDMTVRLATTLAEPKDILAWNFWAANSVDRIGSSSVGLPSSMTIHRSSSMGLACGQGADTVVLRRRSAAFNNWQAWYLFPANDFWDFWGGCQVTFEWFSDTNRGPWADQLPPPTYPIVRLPDFTLMVDNAGNFSLVFGGTDFPVSPSALSLTAIWGVSQSAAIPAVPLPPFPADFTVVRELFRPREMYVVYGGAKFRIRDKATLINLGFSVSQVRKLPPGGTAKLKRTPIDGTLLREQHDQKIYLVDNGKLRQVASQAVMEARCLSMRNVRVVPDKTLAALPQGTQLGPP